MSARLAIASTLALLLAGCPASETPDAGADVASPDAPAPDAPAAPDAPSGLDAPSGSDAPTAADAPVPSDVPSASDAPGAADAPSAPDAPLGCTVDGDCPPALTCLPGGRCGCPASPAPTADAMGRIPDLILTEIVPGTAIELFNTTASDISLPGSYPLCSPFVYAGLGPGTIPAGGYLTIPWPAGFEDTLAGGEVILYSNGSFGSAASVMDFVCWGTNPHGTRQSLAFSAGRWSAGTGGCAPAITGGALHRRPGTAGTSAADYDTTSPPSPVSCTP